MFGAYMIMLSIENLSAKINQTEKMLLNNLNLTINSGEIHVIMGPNGAGKSTLVNLLAGSENYETTTGKVMFCGQDLLAMTPEERSVCGLFLSFQMPVEIPGVNNLTFLKTAINHLREARHEPKLDSFDLIQLIKERCHLLEMNEDYLKRELNAGFSGGEKKRNEMLQLLTLNPQLALLDEPDSGLDIDALKIVARGINAFKAPDKAILMVTHYQRLLEYVIPTHIHLLAAGKIIRSGDHTLALDLEKHGYNWFIDHAN